MKKIFAILVALVLCVSLFTSCKETAVATIGDYKITQDYYNFMYNVLYGQMAQYEQFYGEDWINMEIDDNKTIGDYIKDNTQSQIEQLAIACTIAKDRYSITADRDVRKAVKEQKEQIIQSYGSKDAFKEFINESKTSDDAIQTYLEMCEIYNRLTEKISQKGEECYIPEEDLKGEFAGNMLRVQHILVSTQESEDAPAKTDEEALAVVNEVLGKLAEGADFDSLIAEYNEDPGMSEGGYYTFGEGEMVPEFEEASKKLEIGEYTKEAVKTDYGYHIIKRYDIDFESDEYINFKDSKIYEKMTEVIEKEIEKAKIKWDTKAIDAYIKEWEKERKAAKATDSDSNTDSNADADTDTKTDNTVTAE